MKAVPRWCLELAAFALAIADAMQKEAGEGLHPTCRDTVALAACCAGQWERAAAEQRVAVEAERGAKGYGVRQRRHEGALALRRQREAGQQQRDAAKKRR